MSTENGWGLSLIQRGNTLVGGWYFYDPDGKPTWLVMAGCQLDTGQRICEGPLYRSTSSWLGQYVASGFSQTLVGTLRLEFQGADAATMGYMVDGISGTKQISRLMFGTGIAPGSHDRTDTWWGGQAENGWGLALIQQQAVLVGAWYTYDRSGKPVWYLINGGSWSGDSGYSASLTYSQGSPLIGVPYNPAIFTSQTAGSVSFNFQSANSGTVTFSVDGISQTKPISRLLF